MNKKSFSLLLLSLLLASCKHDLSSSSSKLTSSELSSNDSSLLNTSTSEIESTESSLTSSESSLSSKLSSSSSQESSISSNSSSSTSQSSSSNIDNIPEVSGNNPDGSKRIDVPSNYNNPFDYSGQHYTFDTSKYSSSPIEGGFSLIYGNSKYDIPGPKKYENNEDHPDVNGLKMDYYDRNYNGKSQVGIQSPCLVSNKKIEFRFKVSANHGTQGKNPKKDKPLFTIYSFSKATELIKTDTYFGDKYCSTILNNGEVKIYITPADNVSYFEFRLNQAPYKNNQEFNFNISKLTIRQWEYE